MTDVEFYFDVMCPWAYQTSLWIREAALQRDIRLTLGVLLLGGGESGA